MNIKIYHNTRCGSSRKTCAILEESGQTYEVVNYIKTPLSTDEIQELLDRLGISPMELVRTKEKVWMENYAGRTLTDLQIVEAMQQHPNLIQRPIVVKGKIAVIGRPPELIKDLLEI